MRGPKARVKGCLFRNRGHAPAGSVLQLHHIHEADVARAQLLQAPELAQRQLPRAPLRLLQRRPRLLLRTAIALFSGFLQTLHFRVLCCSLSSAEAVRLSTLLACSQSSTSTQSGYTSP